MDIFIWKELQLFWISILYGAGILLLYDAFRIIRKVIKHTAIIIAIEDLVYWIMVGCIVFSLLYTYNNGSIRGYAILGMAIGMLIYSFTISRVILAGVQKIITVLKNVGKKYLQKPYRNFKKQLQKIQKAVKIAIKGK